VQPHLLMDSKNVQTLVHQQEGVRKAAVKVCQQDPEGWDTSLHLDSPQGVQLLTVKMLVMLILLSLLPSRLPPSPDSRA